MKLLKDGLPTLICSAVLCIILSLGLWPFHRAENDVTWLESRNGLRFGRHGSLISLTNFSVPTSPSQSSFAIEIWAQPKRVWDKGTLFAFTTQEDLFHLALYQDQTALELLTSRTERFHFDDFFPRKGPVFITITSSQQGTAVYANGRLVKTLPQLHLSPEALHGQLVVGDSPGQTDSWAGQMYALAFYRQELTSAQVQQNYTAWTHSGRPAVPIDDRALAVYLFNEYSGRVVHNLAPSGVDLEIPKTYRVVNQIFLEPVWSEFSMSRSYWSAVLKNVVGFIPFGFCFCSYLYTTLRVKRPRLTTVLLGTIVSLTIEVLQAYIPTRDSGTSDIFTNTFGTCIGAMSYDLAQPILVRLLPEPILALLYRQPQNSRAAQPRSF